MRVTIVKKNLVGISVSLMLGAATAADAGILFNPNGTGAAGAQEIASFGWATGNGYTLNGDHSNAAAGATFNDQTLAQARLAEAVDDDNNVVFVGANIPQVTYRVSIPEITTIVNATAVTFSSDPGASASINWFEIYSNPGCINNVGTNCATSLAGTGYGEGTAKLILRGQVTSVVGSFNANGTIGQFDQVGINNFPGQSTIVGGGGTALSVGVAVDWFDTNYFPIDPFTVINATFDTTVKTPFTDVNPGLLFADTKNTTLGTAGAAPALAPNIAVVNGACAFSGAGACNGGKGFQFQQRANTAFNTAVIPEPGSIVLLGTSLLGFAGWRARRKTKS